MKRRFTEKQKKLIEARIKNPDATLNELALKTGYDSEPSVSRALDSPNVKARVSELMDRRKNLTRDSLLDGLEEGLKATRTQFFQHEGVVTDSRECVDFSTRKTYQELAWRLRGELKPDADSMPSQIQIVLVNAINQATERGL